MQVLELEITGRCPLTCLHCFSDSGPTGTHGLMTTGDWWQVITDAAALGIPSVQLIGGEPTSHPDWLGLLDHALDLRLGVEVYSNLLAVKAAWWEALARPGVSLASSYYSDMPAEHDAITGQPGSYDRTRANILEALRRGIPLRVGIVEVLAGQRVGQARAQLAAMGVTRIRTDRTREIGRAATGTPDVSELCGHCGRGRAAVLPDGTVSPCVLSRWLHAGNLREADLAGILDGPVLRELVATIPEPARLACNPDCNPSGNGDDCAPAETPACDPKHEDD